MTVRFAPAFIPPAMAKSRSFSDLLVSDKRYKREAYAFLFEALRYAHETLGFGTETPSEGAAPSEGAETAAAETSEPAEASEAAGKEGATEGQRHLTGRELCEAIRRLALDQFGYMAKTVLNSWGVHNTGDFGNMVFNLIDIGEMSKTKHDRREDFDDVFDFETELRQEFRIEPPTGK
jgi:uncharacterized repeat protein (TIGR04138 family)